jgi:hypothetical protein
VSPWFFYRIPSFSSVVRQMPGYNSQRRGTTRSSQFSFLCIIFLSLYYVYCLCKCVMYCCHRVSTQLRWNVYTVSYHINSVALGNSLFPPGSSSLLQLSQNENNKYGRLDCFWNMPGGPTLKLFVSVRRKVHGHEAEARLSLAEQRPSFYSTWKITPTLCC